MPKITKKKHIRKSFSLREFYEKRNKILIMRETGGLGDILIHRMIFEDIKKLNENIEIHFACPTKYHSALEDHPFIDKLLDSKTTDTKDYIAFYVTTSACNRHEMAQAPYSKKHRADIWANHCGVELQSHNMHINIDEKYTKEAKSKLSKTRKTIAICPISAMVTKNLTECHQKTIIDFFNNKGIDVIGLHDKPIDSLDRMGIPVWDKLSIKEWIGTINAVDGMVSVDSASFHCAGGLNKPLVGIFTFADGKVYSKYYSKSILIQKHRDDDPNWCGPCYYWPNCHKTNKVPKPCLTEITKDMLEKGLENMWNKYLI